MVDQPSKKFLTFYRIRKFITVSPTSESVLGQINPLHTHILLSSNIAFNIILPVVPTCPEWSLCGFSKENVRIYLEELRKMRKPSGVIAGRLADIRVWDLAEMIIKYQLPHRNCRQHCNAGGIL
jgi:hypothetical protein